jgi:hypothetical protein
MLMQISSIFDKNKILATERASTNTKGKIDESMIGKPHAKIKY